MYSKRYLFLDDKYISRKENVIRTFHPWEKEAGNPVIQKEYEWEGIGPYGFRPTGKTGPVTAVYYTFGSKGDDYLCGLATSYDGINWKKERHQLDIIDDGEECGQGFYDRPGTYEGYPYLGTSFMRCSDAVPYAHHVIRRSKNGVHWEKFPGEPYWIGSEDTYTFLYDTRINKYVLYGKLTKVEGETTKGEHFLAYTCNARKKICGDIIRISGMQILPERKEIDVALKCGGSLIKDDGGGGIVDDRVKLLRVVARSESKDFIHWTNQQVVMEPPADAPPGYQYYGMDVQEYAGMYIGHVQLFTALDGHVNIQMVWSDDGIDFSVNRNSFAVACGETGWDKGGIYSANFMELDDGRLCLYYSAINTDHMETDVNRMSAATGRAWLRQDGFASLSGGTIKTVPLKVVQAKLHINMKGVIHITVKDSDGKNIGMAQLRGDYHRMIPEIDLTDYIGKMVTIDMDLNGGEVFSVTI
jgi:hypothetical protein